MRRAVADAWDRFWFERVDPDVIAVFRAARMIASPRWVRATVALGCRYLNARRPISR